MTAWIWSNGKLIAADELCVSPFDRGLTVGLGLFETVLAIDGRPMLLARHLARHAAGCARLGWSAPDSIGIEKGIHDLLSANRLTAGKSRVRLFQTAGSGTLADLSPGQGALTLLTAVPLPDGPERLSLTNSPWVRNERSALAGLKCASYAENLLALADAQARGFDEPLFLNTRDELCETATANLFLVTNGTLRTPALRSGCLPGIARGLVLELARNQGLAAEETTLGLDDLHRADEIFVTSALRGIVPINRLDDRHFIPGPITLRLKSVDLPGFAP